MEDLVVITALNHSGSFGENFIKFKEKSKIVIHQPRSVRIGKNYPQDRGHSFSQYGTPGWRVTYIYLRAGLQRRPLQT